MRQEISFTDIQMSKAIVSNVCTWHDICVVVACAKFVAIWPVIEYQIFLKVHE